MQKNYYIILNVRTSAGQDEIKAAYRTLAKKYHPDRNQGNKSAEEYFKQVQEAYAVLSDPEKRRKYDLSFLNNSSSRSSHRTYAPYTGNAYQYAQQQAQQQYRESPKYSGRPPGKPDKSERYGILVSIAIAIMLLYFIISYSTALPEKSLPSPAIPKGDTTATIPQDSEEESAISSFESPYSAHFGEELYDEQSKNNIIVNNSGESEAVVCLVQNKAPFKTIRNQYMNSGTTFRLNNIPDGEYFLKVYYGQEWNRDKTFPGKSIAGGFTKDLGFAQMNTGKDVFIMKQDRLGSSTGYSSYEISISPLESGFAEIISAEEFFK